MVAVVVCSDSTLSISSLFLFFFNDTATTEIYTLSLHDALPISPRGLCGAEDRQPQRADRPRRRPRSEEHTSELQSRQYLVCRLLLEKKKTKPDEPFRLHGDFYAEGDPSNSLSRDPDDRHGAHRP